MALGKGRKSLERLWVVLGVTYGVFRVIIANATVKKYGVNIWAFAVIEIGSSFPYSLGTARVVGALVDHNRQRAVKWGVTSLVCYAAPEAFILITGHDMPREVYLVIGAILVVLGAIAVYGIVRKVKKSRHLPVALAQAGTSAAR
jgi:hypothetical protein